MGVVVLVCKHTLTVALRNQGMLQTRMAANAGRQGNANQLLKRCSQKYIIAQTCRLTALEVGLDNSTQLGEFPRLLVMVPLFTACTSLITTCKPR